jgi:hypothetical protein
MVKNTKRQINLPIALDKRQINLPIALDKRIYFFTHFILASVFIFL